MLYMLLIYGREAEWGEASEADQAEIMRQHEQLERDLRAAGKYKGCAGLHPTSAATTVRRRGGKPVVVDGPFAETKEQFGGYYLIDARDLDDALAVAARIPGTASIAVEVRPVAVDSLVA